MAEFIFPKIISFQHNNKSLVSSISVRLSSLQFLNIYIYMLLRNIATLPPLYNEKTAVENIDFQIEPVDGRWRRLCLIGYMP